MFTKMCPSGQAEPCSLLRTLAGWSILDPDADDEILSEFEFHKFEFQMPTFSEGVLNHHTGQIDGESQLQLIVHCFKVDTLQPANCLVERNKVGIFRCRFLKLNRPCGHPSFPQIRIQTSQQRQDVWIYCVRPNTERV